MIKLFFIPVLIMLSCGSTKSNQSTAKNDSAISEQSSGVFYQRDSAIIPEATDVSMPGCIKNKIDSFKLKEANRGQRFFIYLSFVKLNIHLYIYKLWKEFQTE